jgi:hypothetical protein
MDSTLTEAAKALARIQRIETTYTNRRAKLDATRAADITAVLANVSSTKVLEVMQVEDPDIVTEFGPGGDDGEGF